MTENSVDLPEECWELIFTFIGHHRHFESISLVCKRFLSLTNRLRRTLTISAPTIPYLLLYFDRFPNINKIRISEFPGDLNSILRQIALSGIDLQTLNLSNNKYLPKDGLLQLSLRMSHLRSLNCSRFRSLRDSDLTAIANFFPLLEELDLSYPEHRYSHRTNKFADLDPVTDTGVISLSLKLQALRKINLSGNQFITDQGLLCLWSNCRFLSDIAIRDCHFISQKGLGSFIGNSLNLVSLSADGIGVGIVSIKLCLLESFAYARRLCVLDLSFSYISDELLCSVAQAGLPLKKLRLSHCHNFSSSGLQSMLSKYQHLEHLDLEAANFLTDLSISEFSRFMCHLTSINLNLCFKLTDSAIFTIARNCPLLNIIKMEGTNVGGADFVMESVVNPQVRSLNLGCNPNLRNDSIKRFACIFPNLEVVDLSNSHHVTEECILGMSRSCGEIRHLAINGWKVMNTLGTKLELPKLEVLKAKRSGISDEALSIIAKGCNRLLQLDFEDCSNVTARGVKEVVENCKKLRKINLMGCENVNVDIVAWMVFSRPSLRKIIPPRGFVPTDSQRNHFLRHGCLVCDGKLSSSQ